MRVMKWSMIALAVSAGTSQFAMASAQDDAKGFVEDSTFSINTRLLNFRRDNRNNETGQSYSNETGLGFNGLYQSGFTQSLRRLFDPQAVGTLAQPLSRNANGNRSDRCLMA